MFEEMLTDLISMPIAYDIGIDIKTTRIRKNRKGTKYKNQRIETVVMTSKEVAEVSGKLLSTVLRKIGGL